MFHRGGYMKLRSRSHPTYELSAGIPENGHRRKKRGTGSSTAASVERKPSVLFIRDWEPPDTGCYGDLTGSVAFPRWNSVDAARRKRIGEMGLLYRTLRARFGDDVTMRVVEPRRLLGLVVSLMLECRDHGLGVTGALRILNRLTTNGLVVNGRLYSQGAWPPPEEVVAALEILI
jgi:hypothetical protein